MLFLILWLQFVAIFTTLTETKNMKRKNSIAIDLFFSHIYIANNMTRSNTAEIKISKNKKNIS